MNNQSDSDSLEQTVELKIKPSQVIIVVLTILAVVGAALIVLRLMDLLILVFVALVIAATIRPMKSALQHKHVPKALAVLLIYLGILGVLVALGVLVVPVLIDQGGALIRGLPQVYASLVSSLENSSIDFIRTLPQRLPTGDQLATQLQAASGPILTSILGIGASVLAFLGQLLSVIILSVYLTLDQSRLERFWLSLASTKRRPELLSIWREIETRLGTYVRGELLLMTSIGVLAGLGYWAIGLPYPLALGVVAGLLEFVPMVGPTLGAIPAVLVALAISPQAALLVVLYSVVIQVTENNILVPRMMGKSVGVSPVMVIVAIFAFTSLLGIAGAFLAIPLAAVFQVLMDHIVVHAGVSGIEEPDEGSTNILKNMRAQIRRLRAEGQQRLRAGRGRINLTMGDRDDVDSQADYLLNRADQALIQAAQTESTDTAEEHTAHLAEVDMVINQAGAMVEEAKVDQALNQAGAMIEEAKVDQAINKAGKMVEEAKVDQAITKAGKMVEAAKVELASARVEEKSPGQPE